MKHVLFCAMILLLLTAVGGCTVEINQSQVTNVENGQEQGQKPDGKQGQPENNGHEPNEGEAQEGETQEGGSQNFALTGNGDGASGDGESGSVEGEATEIEVPVEMPLVVIPPIVVQPVVTLPIVPPTIIIKPVIVKPIIVKPVIVPPYDGTPETEPPVTEPPTETEPPEPTEPPVRLPDILISELRTEYDSAAKLSEFIGFKVNKAMNLQGLKVCIMWNQLLPYTYTFPSIEAKAGECVVLHLRTLESGSVNELGDNLSLSGGTESRPAARDLWASGNIERLRQTDIVYVQDADGVILDAVVLNENPDADWPKGLSHFAAITENLFNAGMWQSPDGHKPSPFDAVDTSGAGSAAKIICRLDNTDTNTKGDWFVRE